MHCLINNDKWCSHEALFVFVCLFSRACCHLTLSERVSVSWQCLKLQHMCCKTQTMSYYHFGKPWLHICTRRQRCCLELPWRPLLICLSLSVYLSCILSLAWRTNVCNAWCRTALLSAFEVFWENIQFFKSVNLRNSSLSNDLKSRWDASFAHYEIRFRI